MTDTANDTAAPGFRLTGRHVAAGLVAFFAVIIALDVLFASLAYKTFSGQSTRNAYTAGLQFNETLAQRRAQAALGWSVEARRDATDLLLIFRDASGEGLEGLSVTAVIERPATEAGRRQHVLTGGEAGVYRLPLNGLEGGWDVRATASAADGRRFEAAHRLVLP